jgi:hypothetical protein
MSKSTAPTKPAAPVAEPSIVITITVSPLKNGKRAILLSGAPEGEMPEMRVGVFSQLHPLLDEVWVTLHKRKSQLVTKPKSSSKEPAAKSKPNATDDEEETAESTGTEATDEVDEEAEADATQDQAATEATNAAAEFEAAILGSESHVQPDQLVRPEAPTAPEEELPVIKGDLTALL